VGAVEGAGVGAGAGAGEGAVVELLLSIPIFESARVDVFFCVAMTFKALVELYNKNGFENIPIFVALVL